MGYFLWNLRLLGRDVSELYKQKKITLLNIVAIIICGNIILKLKEFVAYTIPIGLYVLEDLWFYLLIIAIIYFIYLSIFASFFIWKFKIKNIELTKKEVEKTFNVKKIINLFLRVWLVYTIVYYCLSFLIISNYLESLVNYFHFLSTLFHLSPYTFILLSSYMFSPVATWHSIIYLWKENLLILTDVITIFVVGRYLHFIFHVLRDGLPVLISLYGFKTSLKIVSLNILILTSIYVLTYLTSITLF